MTVRSRDNLAVHARQQSDQCVTRVAQAIAYLKEQGRTVSLRAISAMTGSLAPDGVPPVAVSSIERNPEAYRLYREAAPSPKRRWKRRRPERWLERKTKYELIELLRIARARVSQLERILSDRLFEKGG